MLLPPRVHAMPASARRAAVLVFLQLPSMGSLACSPSTPSTSSTPSDATPPPLDAPADTPSADRPFGDGPTTDAEHDALPCIRCQPQPDSAHTWTAHRPGSSRDESFGEWQSAVATHNGFIYSVWIDDEARMVLSKESERDGSYEEVIVLDRVDLNKYHTMPSVGVDAEGYIHVVGNTHANPYPQIDEMEDRGLGACARPFVNDVPNPGITCASPLPYWVSREPENIRELEFIPWTSSRQIPGTRTSYPTFFRSPTGILFITYRMRVHPSGTDPGDIGASIARYDPVTRTWALLGSTDYTQSPENDSIHASSLSRSDFDSYWYTYNGTPKAWAWAPAGANNGFYQGYRPRLWFDQRNRLHAVSQFHFRSATQTTRANAIFYAYSDDLGATWRRVDGSLQPIPITPTNAGLVVATPPDTEGQYYTLPHVCTDPDGSPIVGYWHWPTSSSRVMKWNGSEWIDISEMIPSSSINFGQIVSDRFGILTVLAKNQLARSWDGGTTWTPLDAVPMGFHIPGQPILDKEYIFQTGNIRFQSLNHDSVFRAQVFTISFSQECMSC